MTVITMNKRELDAHSHLIGNAVLNAENTPLIDGSHLVMPVGKCAHERR
jgi:hypothetical protein